MKKVKSGKKMSIGLEKLEGRELMAGINFNSSTGVLTITGDSYTDTANVRFQRDEVDVTLISQRANGGTIRYHQDEPIARVRQVVFNALGGNDVLNVFQDSLQRGVSVQYVTLKFDSGAGADFMNNNSAVAAYAYGQGGNDVDTFYGGSAGDYLYGDGGDDVLIGGLGADTIDGGAGVDTIHGDYTYLSYTGAGDTIKGGSEVDFIYGGFGADTIDGGAGADQIWGDYPSSSAFGGDDEITGGEGGDTIRGGGGNDYIWGDAPDSRYVANDVIFGEDGNDRLYGGFGTDYLDGGNQHDTMFGGAGRDTLRGGEGDDYLAGGEESRSGSVNNDSDGEADLLYGGTGNDLFEQERATRRTWKIWKWFTEEFNSDNPLDFENGRDREVNWN